MEQETPSSTYSGNIEDVKEYVYKTSNEETKYDSASVTYDTFKTFAIKIVMTTDDVTTVPYVKDARTIALD